MAGRVSQKIGKVNPAVKIGLNCFPLKTQVGGLPWTIMVQGLRPPKQFKLGVRYQT